MPTPTTPIPYEERTQWFHQARFGLFIHYGPYAVPGRGEWVMFSERIPHAEYVPYAEALAPAPGCAEAWVKLAVASGMKYAVLTTRHHDGFSLFNSPVNNFNLWQTRQRDLVREFAEACRKHGLKVGFYYSLLDWRFPGYFEPEAHPESKTALVNQVHDELRHLMSDYGQVDLLWYDGGWIDHGRKDSSDTASFWKSGELNQMIYDLQPGILINNRSGLNLDLDTPEQVVKASGAGRAWESCMTIGDSAGWGFLKHNPNRKTLPTLLQNLISCAADEGNFLINVGPNPEGGVPEKDAERLEAMGQWLEINGQTIYGSQRCELYGQNEPGAPVGRWTRQGSTAYLHIFRWPGNEVTLPLVKEAPLSATLIATGEAVSFTHSANGRLKLSGLPETPKHAAVNVIRFEFDQVPTKLEEKDHGAWVNG